MCSERSRVKRAAARASYDEVVLGEVLDANMIGHVAFFHKGQPYSIPMIYWRSGDSLYFHASPASRFIRHLSSQIPVCISIVRVTGLVMAKSAFHHSMNYQSAVVFGTGQLVEDLDEKRAQLELLVESMAQGRSAECRPPNEKELRATQVLKVEIEDFSVKARAGGPNDEPEDLGLPFWSGTLDLQTSGALRPDKHSVGDPGALRQLEGTG